MPPETLEDVLKSLDQAKAELREELRGLRDDIRLVHERFVSGMAELNRRMDEGFDRMQARFDEFHRRLPPR